CLLAWSVRDGNAEVIRDTLRSACSSLTDTRQVRRHEYPCRILHSPKRNLVFGSVDQLDIANRIRCLLHLCRHAVIAFATEPYGPIYGRVLAYFVLPVVADLRKVIGEHIGCAAAVRAVDYDDVFSRQFHTLVRAGNRRVIPLRDLSKEDTRQSFRREVQRRCHAGNVVGGYNRTQNRWEMQNTGAVLVAICFQLLVAHRPVGRTKIYSAVRRLLDTST